jgi:hypothetical protein
MMMTKSETIRKASKYFRIDELVCEHTLERFGVGAWKFLNAQALETLLVLRTKILKVPFIINTKAAHQRGLRCNLCPLVKDKKTQYLSGHVLGCAFDVLSKEMTAAQMRTLIVQNKDLLPYPIRMEAGVTWLHFDLLTDSDDKITFFEA